MTSTNIPTGKLVITPGAHEEIPDFDAILGLTKHKLGDFGEVSENDWQANLEALESGGEIVSAYISCEGTRFLIITDADRATTTILLPEEY